MERRSVACWCSNIFVCVRAHARMCNLHNDIYVHVTYNMQYIRAESSRCMMFMSQRNMAKAGAK